MSGANNSKQRRLLRHSPWTKLLFCACLGAMTAHLSFASNSLVHKNAPEFVRTDLKQKKLDLLAYRGKVVLLNFWATWCAPCQLEMPHFVAWQKLLGQRGFQVIGISMDDDPALARKTYEKLRLNYPVAMGDEKLGELYGGVYGLPLTYLIDVNGVVQAQFSGEIDLNAIEKQIKALLRP